MTRTPFKAPDLAKCEACGIIGAPAEFTDGTCTDIMTCMSRIRRRHRTAALKDAEYPLDVAHARLDDVRGVLADMADDLAAVQDAVSMVRGTIYQSRRAYDPEATVEIASMLAKVIRETPGEPSLARSPAWYTRAGERVLEALRRRPDLQDAGLNIFDTRHDHDIVDDVARVLAPAATDAGEDPYYSAQAKAAILVTRGGTAAERIMEVWHDTGDPDQRQRAVWDCAEDLYRKVAAGQIIELARDQKPWPVGHECREGRYNTRGDCDGPLMKTHLRKNLFGLYMGAPVELCRSHYAQCVGEGEVDAGAPEVKP